MYFRSARAQHFRLFRDLSFEPQAGLNIVIGNNAAGKTTLLELLYVVSRGGSQRGAASNIASNSESAFHVEARVAGRENQPDDRIEVRWQDRRIGVRINNQTAGLAELVRRMPVLLLDPHTHGLIEDGPGVRRRFIDWGVFHMEHEFFDLWRRFNRALRQRNSALRANATIREIESWSPELIMTASELTGFRVVYVEKLKRLVSSYWQELIDETCWSFEFVRGWRNDETYADTLRRTLDGDRKAGHTREGPHRAELRILSDNLLLKERISRGQQKLLISGLMLAQAELYRQQHDDAPVLLLDDFAAELSASSQQRLLNAFEAWPGQSVITALDYGPLLQQAKHHAMFHVEHCQIKQKNQTI